MKRRAWVGLLVVAAAWVCAAATVQLKNGSSLVGQVIKEDAEHVWLDAGYDVLRLPRAAIQSIQAEAASRPTSGPAAGDGGSLLEYLAHPAPDGPLLTARDIVAQYEDSVVVVKTPAGWGAGFIISPDGYVITNHHVIRGEKKVSVTLLVPDASGAEDARQQRTVTDVKIMAFNPYVDLALLKIEQKALEGLTLHRVPFGDIDRLKKGEAVVAIGNPGLGARVLHHTASQGIVSSPARNIGGLLYIQTTAAVNPGNSGGPLFNAQGHVVGVVTLKATFQENIAFAVPVNYVKDFIKNHQAFAASEESSESGYTYLPAPRRAVKGTPSSQSTTRP
jgi:serine protease Do